MWLIKFSYDKCGSVFVPWTWITLWLLHYKWIWNNDSMMLKYAGKCFNIRLTYSLLDQTHTCSCLLNLSGNFQINIAHGTWPVTFSFNNSHLYIKPPIITFTHLYIEETSIQTFQCLWQSIYMAKCIYCHKLVICRVYGKIK